MAKLNVFRIGGLGCCGCNSTPTCPVSVCVTGCPDGAELAEAGVTIETTDGATVGTGTTTDDGSGHACLGVDILPAGGAGTYVVSVAADGYEPWTSTLELACDQVVDVQLSQSGDPAAVSFQVYGCCLEGGTGAPTPLPGATITLSDGQSCTTDASGQCSFWVGLGQTLSWSVSKSRFVTQAGSITIEDCSTWDDGTPVAVSLSPASGYACPPWDQDANGLPDPIKTTLHLADSAYGSCTITYDPANSWWFGTISGASFSAACGCPAATFDLHYTLAQCGVGTILSIQYNSCEYVFCFGPTVVAHNCPSNPSGIFCTDPGQRTHTILTNCGSDTESLFAFVAGFPGFTVTNPPFEFSGTIPASTCPGNDFTYKAWPGGSTITITE